jgi:hypothetical protein
LEHDGVEAGGLGGVEESDGLLFLGFDGEALLGGKVDIVNAGDPGALEVGEECGGKGGKREEAGGKEFHGINTQRILWEVRFR